MKNGVTNSRGDRQAHIESRVDTSFIIQSEFDPEKQLHLEIQNIWVTETDRWWYAFVKYTPFIGGFSGTTTVKLVSEDLQEVDIPRFFNELTKYPLQHDIADLQFGPHSLTIEFTTTNPTEVEDLIGKCRSIILTSVGSPYGEETGSGVIRPVVIQLERPTGLFNRFITYPLVKRLKVLDQLDRVILWEAGSLRISRRQLRLEVYTSNDEPQRAAADPEDLYSIRGSRDSRLDFFDHQNAVIKELHQLEITVTDIGWGDEIAASYTTRSGTYTALEFKVVPSRNLQKPEGVFGTINLQTNSNIFMDASEEELDLNLGKEYEVPIPITRFIPSQTEDVELKRRRRQNIPREELSKRYLKKHSDAVAITCTGYSLEAYYERKEGEFFTVRWQPAQGGKVWLHSRRNPETPLRKTGLTIWERTSNHS